MTEDNQLKNSFYLVCWVVASLLVLTTIGEFFSPPWNLRRVNLLSDIESEPAPKALPDSVKTKPAAAKIKRDTCRPGVTCIEDFSPNHDALGYFFKALKDTRRHQVKTAFFGDSFIEADILCSSFRDSLQHRFGGRGVGFVPITSQVTSFRRTIQHEFSGWKTYWIVGDKNPFSPPGFSGYCFVPEVANSVTYKPPQRRYGKFDRLKVFYRAQFPVELQYTIDDSLSFTQPLESSEALQQETLNLRGAQAIRIHFEPSDSLKVYGVSFEESTGIFVDNFAMRSNSGIGLYQIAPRQLQEFNNYQHYKLVLLQYGLNVADENDSTGYGWYVEKMVTVISRLRENIKGCSFLLISVSDRCSNQDGKMLTMPNIVQLREAQREIARRSGIAFWDLLSAMNGENSMARLVTATPTLASKDYTHVNFAGGRRLANELVEALFYEREKYDSKSKKLP